MVVDPRYRETVRSVLSVFRGRALSLQVEVKMHTDVRIYDAKMGDRTHSPRKELMYTRKT
jgi:hypothetical protein